MDMVDVDFDENMTVPHPSRHPTTTTAAGNCLDNLHYGANSFNSLMDTIDMHHQQHQAYRQQQQQSAAAAVAHHQQHVQHHQQHQHHHHHNQQQQQQQQQHLSSARQLPNYAPTTLTNHQQQALNLDQQQQQQHYNLIQQQHHQQQNTLDNQRDFIKEQLQVLLQSAHQTSTLLSESYLLQEELIIDNQERSKLLSKKSMFESSRDREKVQEELVMSHQVMSQKAARMKAMRTRLFSELRRIFDQMQEIQNQVLFVHLPRWNQSQQLENNCVIKNESGGCSGNSQIETSQLDRIQLWVELLTDITWRLRTQLRALKQYAKNFGNVNTDQLFQLELALNQSLETLVLKTFIVEKQPPQVMKTNTRFTSSVRFLSGARLNVHMLNPLVKATILSETNARAIIKRHQEIVRSSWSYLGANQQQAQQQQQQPTSMDDQPGSILSPPQPSHSVLGSPPSYPSSNGTSPHQLPVSTTNMLAQQQQVIHSPIPSDLLNTPSQSQEPIYLPPRQYVNVHQQQQIMPENPYQSAQQQQQPVEMIYGYRQKLNISEFEPSGEILNSSNILEYQESTRQLVCNFRNMQLKKIKRTEKKGTESVMDEKFVLLFHSEFRIAEPYSATDCSNYSLDGVNQQQQRQQQQHQSDLSFHIMAFSLPVVVIVHGNQEPHAWATVTWHNAFARRDDLLYHVPDKVYWHELGRVLSDKFQSNAGKGLSAQNLEYLASKVCRQRVDSSQAMVTWNQFAKEPLPERSFTFWEWFHSILKLTREHLRELWNAERIFGFVDKRGCIDILLGSAFYEPCQLGTFLLRYSETELGGITIAWVANPASQQDEGHDNTKMMMRRSPTGSTSTHVLMHILPFVSKDLNTRSLADRIKDLDELVYLYPNMPKDNAFSHWYSRLDENPTSDGEAYVRPLLEQRLPKNLGQVKANSSNDFAITPTTPSSYSQSSPDRIFQDNSSTHWTET